MVLDTATTETNKLSQALAKQSIMVKVVNVDATVYTDQGGRFPVQSNRGNTSVMVYYDVDANFIDRTTKNCKLQLVPLDKLGRKSNQNVQKPLHFNSGQG